MSGVCRMSRPAGHDGARAAGESQTWSQQRNNWRQTSISGALGQGRRTEEAHLVHAGRAAGLSARHLHSAARHRPQYLGTGVQLPGRRHSRHVQHVRRRRHPPHGDLRAEHHAVYFGLDHHSAPDHGVAAARGAEEGRRGRPQDAEPVHPLSDGDAGRVPVLRHRRRAARAPAMSSATPACSSAFRPRSR